MRGPIHSLLAVEHRDLEQTLREATADPERIDTEKYACFRRGLLRHIAAEEKILIPSAKAASEAILPLARKIRAQHGAITALLAPPPSPTTAEESVRNARAKESKERAAKLAEAGSKHSRVWGIPLLLGFFALLALLNYVTDRSAPVRNDPQTPTQAGHAKEFFGGTIATKDARVTEAARFAAALERIAAERKEEAQRRQEEDARLGGSEQARRDVFKEIVAAGDRSRKEVPYPEFEFRSTSEAGDFYDQRDASRKKYEAQIGERHHLTGGQLEAISREGVQKNWP